MFVARSSRASARFRRGGLRPDAANLAATLYRWLECYAKHGLAGLRPRRRKDRGTQRAALPKDVVVRAREILVTIRSSRSRCSRRCSPPIQASTTARRISVAKSTLQRRLAADPLYARLQRGRRLARRRTRFVARAPHDIWHLDAKGPITISLRGRKQLVCHILTVLDDASRATLASLIVLTPDLCAAVRAFRLAASAGTTRAGVRRSRVDLRLARVPRRPRRPRGPPHLVKPRNPEANGKMKRSTCARRVVRSPASRQVVVDLIHLQQLLDGVLETVYLTHRHRGLQHRRRGPRRPGLDARGLA